MRRKEGVRSISPWQPCTARAPDSMSSCWTSPCRGSTASKSRGRLRLAEAAGAYERTRIVALTAHAFAEDRLACLKAGIDEVITKPVDFARLAAVLAPQPLLRSVG